MTQNFWNFFSNTMFWLCFIPVYERFLPVFKSNETAEIVNGEPDSRCRFCSSVTAEKF
jgi:hypothetical protein